MTLASSVLLADRIAGAISIVGISNFVTFLERTESYRRDLRRVEYGDERDPEMRKFLEGISPLNHADEDQASRSSWCRASTIRACPTPRPSRSSRR